MCTHTFDAPVKGSVVFAVVIQAEKQRISDYYNTMWQKPTGSWAVVFLNIQHTAGIILPRRPCSQTGRVTRVPAVCASVPRTRLWSWNRTRAVVVLLIALLWIRKNMNGLITSPFRYYTYQEMMGRTFLRDGLYHRRRTDNTHLC